MYLPLYNLGILLISLFRNKFIYYWFKLLYHNFLNSYLTLISSGVTGVLGLVERRNWLPELHFTSQVVFL